jgi:nicotinamidase-related amidase
VKNEAAQRMLALRKRHRGLPEPQLARSDTALVVIDMQYYDAHPGYGMCAQLKAASEEEAAQYYVERLGLIVPNIQKLLDASRQHHIEVIHLRIQSLTKDGRDRSKQHKNLGIHCPPGSKEAQLLDELQAQHDEIVLTKTCGGAFNGTMIDQILRNIGIQNLIVVGVVTNGCVEATVRDASDRSYDVIVVEDACATWTQEMQAASIWTMEEVYAKIKTTQQVLALVNSL